MTVPEVTPAAHRSLGNGINLDFPFNFAIKSVTEVLVLIDDVPQPYGSYTVSGAGTTNGGNVHFSVPPPDQSIVTRLRAQPISQLVNLPANSSYEPLTIGDALDRHTNVDQMLAEIIGRALKFDQKSSQIDVAVNEPIGNYLLKYNSTGTRVESISINSVASNVFDPSAVKVTIGTDPFLATANYTASDIETRLLVTRGSVAAPRSVSDATLIAQKISNVNNNSASNAAIYASHKKYASGNLNNVTALYAEAEDRAGGAGSFIEGVRGNAVLISGVNGHAGGVIASAQTAPGMNYKYLTGAEGEVINNSGVNAPVIFTNTRFSTAFLATAQGTNLNDAGFMTNPFNGASAKFRAGFLVTESSLDANGSGFMDIGTHIHGLDLALGAFSGACIIIPNNSAIRAKNAAMSQDLNIAVIDSVDQLVLGFDTTAVLIQGNGGQTYASFTTQGSDGQTAMFVTCRVGGVSTLQRVTMGVADSGGAGFKLLRVPN